MNNTSIGFALLDTGTGFTLFNQEHEITVPYGSFALSIINAELLPLKNSIVEVLNDYFGTTFQPSFTEDFISTLQRKIDFHISYSSKGYLHTEQALVITELLVSEILNRIEAEHFFANEIEKYIPILLSDPQIPQMISDILTRNTNDLTKIMEITNTYEIDSQLLQMTIPIYYLHSISDYLLLDLKMYMEQSQRTVKLCECCNRLFLPTRKSDKYCRLPFKNSSRNCNEIMHISPRDEFVKARNNARDKQHKIKTYYENKNIYSTTFLLKLYDDWSIECGKQYKHFKRTNDIRGYRNWITRTRFTSQSIESEWEKYKSAPKSFHD